VVICNFYFYFFLESAKFIHNERVQETQQNSQAAAREPYNRHWHTRNLTHNNKKLPQRMTASE